MSLKLRRRLPGLYYADAVARVGGRDRHIEIVVRRLVDGRWTVEIGTLDATLIYRESFYRTFAAAAAHARARVELGFE